VLLVCDTDVLLCRDDCEYIDCYTVASHGREQTPRWIHHCHMQCETCSSTALELACCDDDTVHGDSSRQPIMMQLLKDIVFTPVDSVPPCVCQPPQSCPKFVVSHDDDGMLQSHWHVSNSRVEHDVYVPTAVPSRPTHLSLADSIHSQRKCVRQQSHQKTVVSIDHVIDRHSCQAFETEPRAMTPSHTVSETEPRAVTPSHTASETEPRALTPSHTVSETEPRAVTPSHTVSETEPRAVTSRHCVSDTEPRALTPSHTVSETEPRALTSRHCVSDTEARAVTSRHCMSDTEARTLTPSHTVSETEPRAVTSRHCASDTELCAVTLTHSMSGMKDESMIVTSDVSTWQQYSPVTNKREVTMSDEHAGSVNCQGNFEKTKTCYDDNACDETLVTDDARDRLLTNDGSDGCDRLVNEMGDSCDNQYHSVTCYEASSSSSSSSSSFTSNVDIDKTGSLSHTTTAGDSSSTGHRNDGRDTATAGDSSSTGHRNDGHDTATAGDSSSTGHRNDGHDTATAGDIERLYSFVRKKRERRDCELSSVRHSENVVIASRENAVNLRYTVSDTLNNDEVQTSCVDHFSPDVCPQSHSTVHLTTPATDVKLPSVTLKVPSSDVEVPLTSALSLHDESCCEDTDLLRSIVGHMTSSYRGHVTGVTSQRSDAGLTLPRGDSECRLLRQGSLLLAHSHQPSRTCVSDTTSLTNNELKSFLGTLLAFDSHGSAFYVPAVDMKVHGEPAGEQWFFPVPITSLQATILLSMKQIAGSFLLYHVFPPHDSLEFQLSVCNGVDILHYDIVRNRHGDLSIAEHDHSFLSLSDLVCYLQQNKSALATRLGRPVSIADRPVTAGVDYDACYELARSQLTITGNIIGNGRFGVICAGQYRGHPVAVKVLSLSVLCSLHYR